MLEQTASKPVITYDDFLKLDLRVATITAASNHPNADRLIKLELDDGTDVPRQVCAGIRPWYEPQDLLGRQVIVVANLEPRKIRGEMSQGMVLAATAGPKTEPDDVILLTLGRPAPAGSLVS